PPSAAKRGDRGADVGGDVWGERLVGSGAGRPPGPPVPVRGEAVEAPRSAAEQEAVPEAAPAAVAALNLGSVHRSPPRYRASTVPSPRSSTTHWTFGVSAAGRTGSPSRWRLVAPARIREPTR